MIQQLLIFTTIFDLIMDIWSIYLQYKCYKYNNYKESHRMEVVRLSYKDDDDNLIKKQLFVIHESPDSVHHEFHQQFNKIQNYSSVIQQDVDETTM